MFDKVWSLFVEEIVIIVMMAYQLPIVYSVFDIA